MIVDHVALGPEAVGRAVELLRGLGPRAPEVRLVERDTSGAGDGARVARLLSLRAATRAAGVALVVSARADLARAVGADAVQLPERGLPLALVRRAFPRLAVGRSCHDRAGLLAAAAGGADWAWLSPLHAPHSKPASGAPLGHAGFAAAVAGVGLPVFALGGATPGDMAPVIAAGGAGLATIGGVLARPDPLAAALAFLGPG